MARKEGNSSTYYEDLANLEFLRNTRHNNNYNKQTKHDT